MVYQRRDRQRTQNTLCLLSPFEKTSNSPRKQQQSALQIAGTIQNANVHSSPARCRRKIHLVVRPRSCSRGNAAEFVRPFRQSLSNETHARAPARLAATILSGSSLELLRSPMLQA